MNKTWQLQDAKNRFSELIDKALREGPQRVTRRGHPVAVVMSSEEYENLAGRKTESLLEFFQASPFAELPIDAERSRDEARDIDL